MHKSSAAVQATQSLSLGAFAIQKARREHIRWSSLCWLDAQRPNKMTDLALLALIQTIYPEATIHELQRELDYLADQNLLSIASKGGRWHLKLTYQGVDVVEYTTSCPAGIGRPAQPNS